MSNRDDRHDPHDVPSAHDEGPALHDGRTVLIAGGTGSVGRVLVDRLLRDGATVIVPSRSARKLSDLRSGLDEELHPRLVTFEGDVGDEDAAPALARRIAEEHGPIHAAVATLGRFVPVDSVLDATVAELEQVIDGYLTAHFVAAKALVPVLAEGGSYTLINGPLAFRPMFARASLVSTVTAAQAMLARLLMEQVERVRVNELVLHTGFGWGDDGKKGGAVSQSDVARYVSLLTSDRGDGVRGRTIHLDSLEPLGELEG